jgi:serine/threonine protein kinase
MSRTPSSISYIDRVLLQVRGGKTWLNNEYEFLSVLGEGSYGEVVLARRGLGSQGGKGGDLVAVKCFSKSRLYKKRDIRRDGEALVVTTGLDKVVGELLALSVVGRGACSEVLVLQCVVASKEADEFFYVFDFVDAGPLMVYDGKEERFKGLGLGGPLPLTLCRQLLCDLVAAVFYCHAQGVAHRDIKPDNLLVTSKGGLVLCDFGVASIFRGPEAPEPPLALKTALGMLPTLGLPQPPPTPPCPPGSPIATVRDTAGALLFVCPEAASGLPYSAFAADLWAFGVVMHCMLFGVVPFGRGLKDPTLVFESIARAELGGDVEGMAGGEVFPWDLAVKEGSEVLGEGGEKRKVEPARTERLEASDLLQRLLTRDATRRITTAEALASHPFFSKVVFQEGSSTGGSMGPPNTSLLRETRLREVFPPTNLRALPLYTSPEMAMDLHAPFVSPEGEVLGSGVMGGAGSMSGWMMKRGGNVFMRVWRPRYFVLTDGGTLLYFTKPPLECMGVEHALHGGGGGELGEGEGVEEGIGVGSFSPRKRTSSNGLGRRRSSGGGSGAFPAHRNSLSGAFVGGGGGVGTSRSEEDEASNFRGYLNLYEGGEGCSVMRRCPKSDKPWRFSLTTPSQEFLLQANSERDLTCWEAALKVHCKRTS